MTWQTKVVRGALALGVIAVLAIASGAGWFDILLGWFD
jgi:hypothetical protein